MGLFCFSFRHIILSALSKQKERCCLTVNHFKSQNRTKRKGGINYRTHTLRLRTPLQNDWCNHEKCVHEIASSTVGSDTWKVVACSSQAKIVVLRWIPTSLNSFIVNEVDVKYWLKYACMARIESFICCGHGFSLSRVSCTCLYGGLSHCTDPESVNIVFWSILAFDTKQTVPDILLYFGKKENNTWISKEQNKGHFNSCQWVLSSIKCYVERVHLFFSHIWMWSSFFTNRQTLSPVRRGGRSMARWLSYVWD